MTETNRSLPPEKSGLTRRPGCALDREFYSSREIFEQDVERIYLRHWLFSGHVSRLARSGDFFSLLRGGRVGHHRPRAGRDPRTAQCLSTSRLANLPRS